MENLNFDEARKCIDDFSGLKIGKEGAQREALQLKSDLAASEAKVVEQRTTLERIHWALGGREVTYVVSESLADVFKQLIVDVGNLDGKSRAQYDKIQNLVDLVEFLKSHEGTGAVNFNNVDPTFTMQLLQSLSIALYSCNEDGNIVAHGGYPHGSPPSKVVLDCHKRLNKAIQLPGVIAKFVSKAYDDACDTLRTKKAIDTVNDIWRFRNGRSSKPTFGLILVEGIPTDVPIAGTNGSRRKPIDCRTAEETIADVFAQELQEEVTAVHLLHKTNKDLNGSALVSFYDPKAAEKAIRKKTFLFDSYPHSVVITVAPWNVFERRVPEIPHRS